jgi:hypothetical protein
MADKLEFLCKVLVGLTEWEASGTLNGVQYLVGHEKDSLMCENRSAGALELGSLTAA